jgi:hypothetical protein
VPLRLITAPAPGKKHIRFDKYQFDSHRFGLGFESIGCESDSGKEESAS